MTFQRLGILVLAIGLAFSVLSYLWPIVEWFELAENGDLPRLVVYCYTALIVVGLALWISSWYMRGMPRLSYGNRYVFLPILVLFTLVAVGSPWTDSPLAAVLTTLQWLAPLVLFVGVANEADRWSMFGSTSRSLWRSYVVADLREGTLGSVSLALAIVMSSMTFSWLWKESYTSQIAEYGGFVAHPTDILLVVGLVLWVAGWYKAGKRKIRVGPWYIFGPLLLLLLGALSIPFAVDPLQATSTIARRVVLIGLYIALVNETVKGRQTVLWILLAIGVLHALVGLMQMVISGPVGLSWLGENEIGSRRWPIGNPRAYGLAANPTPLGLHLGVYASIACAAVFFGDYSRRVRLMMAAIAVLLVAGLVASGGRMPLAGWLVGIVVVLLFAWARRRRVSMKLALQSGLVVGAVLLVVGVATSSIDRGGLSRITPGVILRDMERRFGNDNDLAIPLIQSNPIIGVGAGNYSQGLSRHIGPNEKGKLPRVGAVHSTPLLVASEQGLLSALALAVLIISPLLWAVYNWRRLGHEPSSLLWVGAALVVLGMSLTDFGPWGFPTGRVLLWGVLGLWAGSIPVRSSLAPNRPQQP